MAVGMMIAAPLGGKLSAKIEPRFLTAFGMFWAAGVMYLFSGIDIKWTGLDIAFRMFLFAAGLGLGMSPLTTAATSTVPTHEIGIASSVLALARNIAGAFGIAIFATILTNSFNTDLSSLRQFSTIHSTSPLIYQQVYALIAVKANIMSFASVYRAAIFFMFIGGVSALFIKTKKGTKGSEEVMVEF